MFDFAAIASQGLSYQDFLAKHGTDEHRRRWDNAHREIALSDADRLLLGKFKRKMPVVCLAGAWCGDCVYQCPIFDRIAAASPNVQMLYYDRDANPELAAELKVCGGNRVPVVVFLNEDMQEVGRYGDRTLARYRYLAAQLEGAACPTGFILPDPAEQAKIIADWMGEFERAQLILRTSPRLRDRHGD